MSSGRRLLSVSVAVALADVVPVLPGHWGPVVSVLGGRPVASHVLTLECPQITSSTEKSDETTRCQKCQITASERVSVSLHNKYFSTPVFSLVTPQYSWSQ